MSNLVIIEVTMKMVKKNFQSDLYDIYFGNNFCLHYDEATPFVVIGLKEGASKKAVTEFLAGIPGFRVIHEKLFGKKVNYLLMSEKEFKTNKYLRHNYKK